jgi:hypothetical protein
VVLTLECRNSRFAANEPSESAGFSRVQRGPTLNLAPDRDSKFGVSASVASAGIWRPERLSNSRDGSWSVSDFAVVREV